VEAVAGSDADFTTVNSSSTHRFITAFTFRTDPVWEITNSPSSTISMGFSVPSAMRIIVPGTKQWEKRNLSLLNSFQSTSMFRATLTPPYAIRSHSD
jgi:hypothetical protein